MIHAAFGSGGELPDPLTDYPTAMQGATLRYYADPDGRVPIEPDADGVYRLREGQFQYWVEVVSE